MNRISTCVLYINGFDTEDLEFFSLEEYPNKDLFSDVYDFLNKNEYKVRDEVVDNLMNFARFLTSNN